MFDNMKTTRNLFFLCLFALLMMVQTAKAQKISSKTKVIDGKEYYMHYVRRGETLYGLSLVYKVSIEEITQLNPQVKNGLKAETTLKIPVRVKKKPKPKPTAETPKTEPIVEKPAPSVEVPKSDSVSEAPTSPTPPVVEEPVSTVEEPKLDSVIEPPQSSVEVFEPIVEEQEMMTEEMTTEVPEEKVSEKELEERKVVLVKDGRYVVQEDEDLYDIAKKFGIDLADFKAINSRLTNRPRPGTVIMVPNIVNENDYIVHKSEYNERVSSLLKRWKIDESEFRAINISVGSHVFVNQAVLIPIEQIKPELWAVDVPVDEPIVETDLESIEEPQQPELLEPVELDEPAISFNEPLETPECYADPENATRLYKVALMIPLYLNDIDNIEISKDKLANVQKSRSLSFLPFYEGFMMAVEKMTDEKGLKLDLAVIDVTENVNTAQRALEKVKRQHFDMIIGPFFSKSFAVVEDYAKEHDILVVNPLSTRHEVVEGNANVIKLKPAHSGLVLDIAHLVRNHYADAKVFILSRENMSDSLFLTQLERELNRAVNDEVTVSGNEFLQFAKDESQRLEMGSRMVPTVTVEGQVYSTNELKNGSIDHVTFANPVHRFAYDSKNLLSLVSQLSGVRNNVIIAYGDDNVFATQVLNTLKKEADRFPITLVCAPDWSKFEKLLVENLLQMNAIYLTDNFVDYRSNEAKQFVLDFRSRYVVEPQNYAFEGYDVATYFLTALMRYGKDMTECLPYFTMPLLHAKYRFMRIGEGNGLENHNWNLYQYDDETIELVPVNPFKKPEE